MNKVHQKMTAMRMTEKLLFMALDEPVDKDEDVRPNIES